MLRLILLIAPLFVPTLTLAQSMASHCLAVAGRTAPLVHLANFQTPVTEDQVRITYVDHAMFLIQGGGASAATDYTGFLGMVDFVPDVVTMNNAHETHFTRFPDPDIAHILNGWPTGGQPADHWIKVADMVVRNVTSDIRGRLGEVREDGNSVFVFEAGGLCIAHVGHLHQELSPNQIAQLGRMDVIMVPVDGGTTMSHDAMVRVIQASQARVVIPMHWFTISGRDAFIDRMRQTGFAIDRRDSNSFELGLLDLPRTPTLVVLTPDYLRNP